MKTALNVLAVVGCLVWVGMLSLYEYGRALGSLTPSSHGETVAAVSVVVSLAVLASVIASRYSEGNRAWALAASPFVFMLVGHAFLDHQRSSARASHEVEERSRARDVQSRFDATTRQFSRRGDFGESSDLLGSILVIDHATHTMVRVDHRRESLEAFCVGGIDGNTLELWGEMGVHGYTDDAGRTVEERFTVARGHQPEGADCPDEAYSF